MNRTIGLSLTLSLLTLNSFSQAAQKIPAVTAEKAIAVSTESNPLTTAMSAIKAHGGDNFKQMKSFLVRGTVDVTGTPTYVIPATFMIVISGDKYVFELNNPIQPLKQVFDGKESYSSGYELPPVTSLGFPVLASVGDKGYTVSAIGVVKKKRNRFRVTTPDGFYTDFIVDDKTGQIKGYESSYDIDGRIVTTSVEIDEFETVKGV